MSDDLITRVRAAIWEKMRVAQEAADGDSGEWFVGRKWNVYRAEDMAPDDEPDHRLVVYCNVLAQSEHIALQNPKDTLRGCEADLRVLVRHKPPLPGWPTCDWCRQSWPCPDVLDRAAAYNVGHEEDT